MNINKKILFFAEAVTLAHVCRVYVLAKSLLSKGYEIYFACDQRMLKTFDLKDFHFIPIKSIKSEDFLERIETGKRLYKFSELQSYAEEELRVMREVQPDLVVGDLRVSLAVTTQVLKVPYWLITNAYWSPYAKQKKLPVPEIRGLPLTRIPFIDKVLPYTQSLVLKFHSKPINALCRKYKIPVFKKFLDGFTYSDQTFYADVPELAGCDSLPENHSYLGQIKWSAEGLLPPEFNQLKEQDQKIFVNLGSSGPVKLLEQVIRCLLRLDFKIIVATAGRAKLNIQSHNLFVSDFLPAESMSRLSDIVICNGGSPSSYLAISNAVPVIGIPTNLDQLLNMRNIEQQGAGISIRASEFTLNKLESAVLKIFNNSSYKDNCYRLAASFASYNAIKRFNTEVDKFFNNQSQYLQVVGNL